MVRELKHLAIIFWIILSLFYGLYIYQMSRAIGLNSTFQALREQSNKLTLDNQLLEVEIAKQSSLQEIEKKAQSYGFSEIKKVEYIKFQETLATK